MKYQITMEIDLPRDKVVELFDNAENLKEWQPDLISFEHLSGEPSQVGAKSKLCYQMGKRKIEMIETITENNLPDSFCGTYEADGCDNVVNNHFVDLDGQKTRWEFETEFKMSGVLMKIMAFLMPGAFKKHSLKFMQNFKEFAEKSR